jgi:hypothetical protein
MISFIPSSKMLRQYLKIDHDCIHILLNLSLIGKVHAVLDVVAFVIILWNHAHALNARG